MQQAQVDTLAAMLAEAAAGEAALTARLAAVAGETRRMQGARAEREREYRIQREVEWQAALDEEGRLVRCANALYALTACASMRFSLWCPCSSFLC